MLTAILLTLAVAQPPAKATPAFIVETAAGTLEAAPLLKWDADFSLRLAGTPSQVVEGAKVVSMQRQGVPLPPYPQENFVLLSTGERLSFQAQSLIRLDEDEFHLEADGIFVLQRGTVVVPQVGLVLLCFNAAGDEIETLLNQKKARPRDVVHLRNGDRVEGTLTGLDRRTGCRITAGNRKLEIPLAKIALIAFSTELQDKPTIAGPYAALVLKNGSRLQLTQARLDAERRVVVGKTLFGSAAEVELEQIVNVDVRQGRAVYLSDLKAKAYEMTPFLGVAWPIGFDATLQGRQLRVGTRLFDKGLNLHSKSTLTYALDGKYRTFEAIVGVDPTAGPRARVQLKVLVDGQEARALPTREWSHGDAPLALRIDVGGAKELTLIVDFASLGDVQGQATWAAARLIRGE